MEDGWKITHFLELSSSLYCSHHQPITPFLEDMADFSRTYVLYLQEYIDEICSELTTFAVESPTDGVYFIKEVKRVEEKIVVKKSAFVNFH